MEAWNKRGEIGENSLWLVGIMVSSREILYDISRKLRDGEMSENK